MRVALALACAASVQLAVGAAEPPGRMRLQLPPSSAVESRLNAAQRQIDNQRWDVALPLLQEIIQQQAESLVWTGDAYEPATLVAQRKLAALPPEGRRTYVLLYEPEAGRLLAEGIRRRSEPLLAQVAQEYGNTPSGARAAGALADLLMDEGRFHDALNALSSAEADVPSGEGARLLLARKIACLAHLGDAAGIRRAVRAALERDITEVAPAGEPMAIEEFGERCLRRHAPEQPQQPVRPAPEPKLPYSVSFEIGGAERSPVGVCSRSDTLFVGGEDGVTALDLRRLRTRRLASPDQLLRRTAAMLSGTGPEDDVPLWLPVGNLDFWRRTVNQGTRTITATADRVLTVDVNFGALELPEEPWNARPGEVLLPNSLRCIDARDGRLLWRAGGREGRSLAGFWFPTAPAVEGDRCYVLGVRAGVLWAVCLDIADGREVWRSRVGSIESRNETQRYIMEFYLADASPPVVTRGLAVFPTGQGAVAAFNARDGHPRWLTPYPRSDRDIPRLGQTISVPWSGWRLSRPVVADGTILVTPLDSRHLLCIDTESGRLRWQTRLDNGLALLGRRDDRVLVQRHSGLSCLSLSDGRPLWEATIREQPVGRAALVNDVVCVPYDDALRGWQVETGRAEDELRWPTWIANRGDLVALSGTIAMVSPDRVTLSVHPSARAATDGESMEQRFLRAVDEFLDGRPDEAARLLGAVLEEPGPLSDQAAVLLAETGLEFGRRDLLERAMRNTPRTAELRAALAEIELRFALRHTPPERAASAYMELVRNRGMEPAPASVGSASLWLRLRSALEREWAGEPDLRDRLKRAFAEQVRSAAENRDEDVLAAAARHAPFGAVRAEATLVLGRFWEASGRNDAARRVFTEFVLYGGDADIRRTAARELEALGAALSPTAPAECAPPTGETLWSAPGRLVLPAPGSGPRDTLLLVDRERLRRVRVSDGREIWATALPPAPKISGPVDILERPRQLAGPGYPTCCRIGDRIAVGLPGNVFSVRGKDGELL
ncbi:MAG: PQQ-binding-like beta-propeller repeat protein, partial [Candidatus Brocadiia bacterium]